MGVKLTYEAYVARANKVHDNKYSYKGLDSTYVIFSCKEHGEQRKRKFDHLNGGGCVVCGIAARGVKPTIEDYASRARVFHGDKYTYLRLTDKDKVVYRCDTHGEIEQHRGNHIQGHGCPKCGRRKEAHATKVFPQLVANLERVHGNKYHYIEFAGGYMMYECPSHGEKIQKYADLLRGYGCIDCGTERSSKVRTETLEVYLSKVPDEVKAGLKYLELDTKNIMFECESHGLQIQGKHVHKTGLGCPSCSAGRQISRFSENVSSWLSSLGLDHTLEDKSPYFGSKYTADILIDKLVLELNGDYWHTEDRVGVARHKEKYNIATEHGYDFMMFSDNEWASKQQIIKSSILHRLGKGTQTKSAARKLTVSEIEAKEARILLEQNHIQGFAASQTWFGLKEAGCLIAVAGFSLKDTGRGRIRNKNICELVRYCTSKPVVGGLGRLIAAAKRSLQFSTLNTFSDDRFFSGSIYKKLGFTAVRKIPPSYYYAKSGKVINKASLQKSAFARREDLLFDKDLTERELAELNGYKRSYDAGRTLWTLNWK